MLDARRETRQAFELPPTHPSEIPHDPDNRLLMQFLIPARDDVGARRADLSLGLRAAARHYNELVVPGIGGARRVRHVSWAVAGIRLRDEASFKGSAVSVAHALEALGNKLEWWRTPEDARRALPVPGKNAFRRNPDAWEFSQLCQRRFYVQVTHRQVTARALPIGSGLNFTDGSTRYSGMALAPLGKALADALLGQDGVGTGTPRVAANLAGWIQRRYAIESDSHREKLRRRIGPFTPTPEERAIVLGRLESHLSPHTEIGRRDPARRARLLLFLDQQVGKDTSWRDTASLLRWLAAAEGGAAHARDVQTALRFEDMRAAAVAVVGALVGVVAAAGVKIPVNICAATPAILASLDRCRQAAASFRAAAKDGGNGRPDVDQFAGEAMGTPAEVVPALVRRDGRILTLAGDAVWRGTAWRADVSGLEWTGIVDGTDETTANGRPDRLFQLIGLWRDCNGEG
jgi:hypothetical protein